MPMKATKIPRARRLPLLLPLLLVASCLSLLLEFSEAGKRVTVPDELDDVVDDEEDEEWKRWGQKKRTTTDLPSPPDFSRMSPLEIQSEMMKRHSGPTLGFVKLRPGVPRSREDVPVIAMKWSKVLKTGSVEAKFLAVDLNTIMFTLENGQDLEELKDFVLSQQEAYEIKIGEQLYRRPGDPPLNEVESLRKKINANSHDAGRVSQEWHDEM